VVAAGLHVDRVVATAHHDDLLDARRGCDGLVGLGLEREHLAAAIATIGGDEHLRLRIVDAVGQRLGREAAEHHAVRSTDACTGEHRDCGLGDHRQVDVDAIALLDTEGLQRVSELRHLVEQLLIGDDSGVTGLALPVEGNLVAAAGEDMTVETVVRHVQLSAEEPLRVREVPLADTVPVPAPGDEFRRLTRPERFVVLVALVVQLGPGYQRVLLERSRRRELAVLEHQVIDCLVGHGVHPPGCRRIRSNRIYALRDRRL